MASLFVSERAIALLACCSALFALYLKSLFAFLLTFLFIGWSRNCIRLDRLIRGVTTTHTHTRGVWVWVWVGEESIK